MMISVAMKAARSAPQSNPPKSDDFLSQAIAGSSAHVGQMVKIHYRWHPLYGGCFRHESRKDRASGAIVRVEVRPGEVIQVAE